MIQNEFIQNLLHLLVFNPGELIVFGTVMLLLQMLLIAYKGQKFWDRSSIIDISYSFLRAFCTPFFYLLPIAIVDRRVQLSPTLVAFLERLSSGIPFLLQLFYRTVHYRLHRLLAPRTDAL